MSAKNITVNKDFPFLGLEAYSETEKDFFFGRTQEVETFYELIRKQVITVLCGKAGIGKTSLLRAGLSPKLQKNFFLPVIVHVKYDNYGLSPLEQVKSQIEHEIKKVDKKIGPVHDISLWEFFHKVKILDGLVKPVLIFDQFEEIFSEGKNNQKQANELITEIANLIENQVPVSVQEKYKDQEIPFSAKEQNFRVVFSIREDFIPQLENLYAFIPSLHRSFFKIDALDRQLAIEILTKAGSRIINKPEAVKIVNQIIEKTVPDYEAVKDNTELIDNTQIEPFLLSLIAYQINNLRIQEYAGKIDQEILQKADIDRIIKNFYYQATYDLGQETKNIIENGLLTQDGYRKLQHKNDLLLRSGITEQDIKSLVNRRIIRSEIWKGSEHLELIHDILVPIVKESRDKRMEMERKRKREEELQEIREQEQKKRAEEKKKLEEKARIQRLKSQQKIRFRSIVAVTVSVTLIIVSFFAFKWYQQKQIAQQNALEANSNMLAATAIHQLDNDPTLGFRIAEKAHQLDAGSRLVQMALLESYFQFNFYSVLLEGDESIFSVDYSPNGEFILVARGEKVQLIDKSGKILKSFKKEEARVNKAKFLPDGKRILSVYENGNAYIWSLEGKVIQSLTSHKEEIYSANFSETGDKFITASADNLAIIWSSRGHLLKILEEHTGDVFTGDISYDDKFAITGGFDNRIILWDIQATGEAKIKREIPFNSRIKKLRFIPGTYQMIVATDDYQVAKIDTAGNKIADFEQVNCLIEAISFSPDKKEVIFGGNDKVIRMFDLQGNLKMEYKGHRSGITSLSFSPNGKNIVSCSNDNTLRIWHIVRRNRDIILTSSKASFYFVESSPDSNYILSALGKLAVISSKKQPKKQYHLKGHNQDIYCAKYSPSGKYIGTASKDSTVRIWSNKGTHLKTLTHGGEVFSLDFSPSGDKIVTACSDGKAYVWDIAQGKAVLALPEQSTQVNISLFTPDGKSILTVGSNSFATLWNMQGKIIRKFKGHDDLIFGADFSPDGKYLATSGYDKSIIIWNMDGTIHQRLVGHEGEDYTVSVSDDSKKLISAGTDNTVRLWDINSNLIYTYTGHNSEVFNAKFDSDGNYVLSVSWDNEVRLWPVNPKELIRLVNETKIFRNVWRPKEDDFFNNYMK